MSSYSREFEGKDVAEAIKSACDYLHVSQEELEITVITPGSSGVFGLCRKMAKIKVALKSKGRPETEAVTVAPATPPMEAAEPKPAKDSQAAIEAEPLAAATRLPAEAAPEKPARPAVVVDAEVLAGLTTELRQLLELIGSSSSVELAPDDYGIRARIDGPDNDFIIGPNGQTLDALQYLFRKIAAKRYGEQIVIALDVGDFRSTRQIELETMARQLAAAVKESGKTKSTPPLNPAERRIVHVSLQNDNQVRSRSVGEGLLKKILVYTPGKGRKPAPRKRRGAKPKAAPVDEQS